MAFITITNAAAGLHLLHIDDTQLQTTAHDVTNG
jgi:hypothetical protein